MLFKYVTTTLLVFIAIWAAAANNNKKRSLWREAHVVEHLHSYMTLKGTRDGDDNNAGRS